VKEFLLSNSLEWAIKYFEKISFSLELVPYIDGEQLDDLLTLAKCEIRKSNKASKAPEEPSSSAPTASPKASKADADKKSPTEIDPVEKIKLVCALRAMRTQLQV